MGRLEQAITLEQYIVARDPVNITTLYNLGLSYSSAGRADQALASLQTVLRLNPGDIGSYNAIGKALLLKGDARAALAEMQQESFEFNRLEGLVMVYHALGQKAESDAELASLIDKYEQDAAYNIAYVLAFRGEADRAFEWLDKAVGYKDAGLAGIPTQYQFASLHKDPRWQPFLESIGKSPEQLAAIEFRVKLPD